MHLLAEMGYVGQVPCNSMARCQTRADLSANAVPEHDGAAWVLYLLPSILVRLGLEQCIRNSDF